MNKLKFRAWDEASKKLRYDVTGFECSSEGEIDGVFIDGDYFRLYGKSNLLGKPIAIVMQSTGLKDHSGTEIYEGDILKTKTLIVEIGTVKFGEFDAPTGDYYKKSGTGFYLESPSGAMVAITQTNIEESESIVIGNVVENSELVAA